MNYTKPEVAVLGEAVRVIEQVTTQKGNSTRDGAPLFQPINPAYDLDE